MAHAYYHSKSSAKIFGGKWEDYIDIHRQMDETKGHHALNSHRLVFHSSYGCKLIEKIFGLTIKNSQGKDIPVSAVVERHIIEDLGWIPSLSDWLNEMPVQEWMYKKAKRLSKSKTLNQTTD